MHNGGELGSPLVSPLCDKDSNNEKPSGGVSRVFACHALAMMPADAGGTCAEQLSSGQGSHLPEESQRTDLLHVAADTLEVVLARWQAIDKQ